MKQLHPRRRSGFSIPELLIALAISATLLLATMMALGVSFRAFQSTTRTVSTGVTGRIVIERLQTLIRTGVDFGPLPGSPLDSIVDSDILTINMGDGDWVTLRWDQPTETIYWEENGDSWPLLEGVTQLPAGENSTISPFTLEFKEGRWLNRAVIDLVVEHDDAQDIAIEGTRSDQFRLIGSAMPRVAAWD
ncbi:MAG: prepilin-type N-terminal cleavage/methylation domain-containing protein [Phycisphaerales bacterium]|nr:prepilin-type N-terminal cleavage/methylation domain-containing protein [Phycisphaerales bacterium]